MQGHPHRPTQLDPTWLTK